MEKNELMVNITVFINAVDIMMKGNIADFPKNLANISAFIEGAKLAVERQSEVDDLPWFTPSLGTTEEKGKEEEETLEQVEEGEDATPKKRKRRTKVEMEAARELEKISQAKHENDLSLQNELIASSKALANDPDMLKEMEAWEVTLNDGLEELEKAEETTLPEKEEKEEIENIEEPLPVNNLADLLGDLDGVVPPPPPLPSPVSPKMEIVRDEEPERVMSEIIDDGGISEELEKEMKEEEEEEEEKMITVPTPLTLEDLTTDTIKETVELPEEDRVTTITETINKYPDPLNLANLTSRDDKLGLISDIKLIKSLVKVTTVTAESVKETILALPLDSGIAVRAYKFIMALPILESELN